MQVEMKKRSPNFTPQEKNLLISIIANKYANILENKKTNQVSITEKLNAWKNIENEFNAVNQSGVFRSFENLKLLYENQKKEVRKNRAALKMERITTGGGPPTIVDTKDSDEILAGIMNDKTISGLTNNFDCDVSDEVCMKITHLFLL